MATFEEVQAAVRKQFTLDSDADHEFSITLEAQSDRAQRVMVRRYQAWGTDMVEFRSAFAKAGEFDPVSLLESNLQLPLGCVAQHGAYLVLVHKCSLQHLSVEGVLFLMGKMSVLADVLEERTGTDRF
jgi:hypothetical protein